MIRRSFLAALPAGLAFAGETRAALAPSDAVQLRIRAGGDDDAAVYEAVFAPFADVMPLKRQPPFSHTLDVTFASVGRDWLRGRGDVVAARSNDHWYVGDGSAVPMDSGGGGLKWQTSRMRTILKRATGEAIWSADYTYDGGFELSGWTVKTPAQAARLIARRLAARYRSKAG